MIEGNVKAYTATIVELGLISGLSPREMIGSYMLSMGYLIELTGGTVEDKMASANAVAEAFKDFFKKSMKARQENMERNERAIERDGGIVGLDQATIDRIMGAEGGPA